MELPFPFAIEAPDICIDNSPSITILNSVENYTYDIFSNIARTTKVSSLKGTGDNLNSILPIIINKFSTFYVKIYDEKCSAKDIETFSINVKPIPFYTHKLPDFLPNEYYEQSLIKNPTDEPLSFSLIDGELPKGLYLNSFGILSGIPNPEKELSKNLFTLKTKNLEGCTELHEYELSSNLFIPNVFTPNRDGFNDIFMSEYHVVIFDRFGVKIFDGETGWDGTYKGQDAPPDIYFYKVYYTTSDGETKTQTGYVGLER